MTVTAAALTVIFIQLSVLAFGGGNSVLPEMQRQIVQVHHWMTAADFNALYGLAQAAPGPNMMVVPLLGWQLDGWKGLIASSLAMFLPSAVITGIVLHMWDRFHHAPWRAKVQAGLMPVTAGLVGAGALLIAQSADRGVILLLITAATAVISLKSRQHPLWFLAAGALCGVIGLR